MSKLATAVANLQFGKKLSEPEDNGRGGQRTHSVEVIAAGEKVTKSQLGVSDEEWEALVAGGSIVLDDGDYPPAHSPEATAGREGSEPTDPETLDVPGEHNSVVEEKKAPAKKGEGQ